MIEPGLGISDATIGMIAEPKPRRVVTKWDLIFDDENSTDDDDKGLEDDVEEYEYVVVLEREVAGHTLRGGMRRQRKAK